MDYDLVICSTAKRTIETAEILLMASQKNIKLLKIKSLYLPLDDGDINDISKMLTMHPYATPKEMLSYDKAGAWDRYADNAYDDIINAAHENQSSRLLIIGHSTITNLLGVKFGGNVDPLMSFMIGSCQGFSVICNKRDRMSISLLIAFLTLSFLLSYWGCGRMIRILSTNNIIDTPNHRSNHKTPTPTGGGIAILSALLFGSIPVMVWGNYPASIMMMMCLTVFLVSFISFLDDIKDLHFGLRLVVHILASCFHHL